MAHARPASTPNPRTGGGGGNRPTRKTWIGYLLGGLVVVLIISWAVSTYKGAPPPPPAGPAAPPTASTPPASPTPGTPAPTPRPEAWQICNMDDDFVNVLRDPAGNAQCNTGGTCTINNGTVTYKDLYDKAQRVITFPAKGGWGTWYNWDPSNPLKVYFEPAGDGVYQGWYYTASAVYAKRIRRL